MVKSVPHKTYLRSINSQKFVGLSIVPIQQMNGCFKCGFRVLLILIIQSRYFPIDTAQQKNLLFYLYIDNIKFLKNNQYNQQFTFIKTTDVNDFICIITKKKLFANMSSRS